MNPINQPPANPPYLCADLTICPDCHRGWNGTPRDGECPVCKHRVEPI